MKKEIEKIIKDAIDELIKNTISNKKLASIKQKQKAKIHFIPFRYRVLGAILQSMNIQFGNFLEKTIKNIIELNSNNKIINELSGKKKIKFQVSKESIELIDEYILKCQTQNFTDKELENEYNHLIDSIILAEKKQNSQTKSFIHDIDLLFKKKDTGEIVYVEIKYNDDHDTGKFIDINRKFLYTTALLIRKYKINKPSQIKPVLMYFNNKKMKGNIYIPENLTIYRGKRFFDTFTTVDYNDIDYTFKNISKNKEINKKFDKLCNRILNKSNTP